VSVTDQCGSVLSDAVTIDVQHVEADFLINYTDEYDVTFYNTSSSNSTEFLWKFGDGGLAQSEHTAHHYIDTDDHTVWLTVWNPIGCVDSTSVLVQPPAHVYVPNAFSPDGDGVNETFGPIGHDLYDYELRIFDRWGEVIFETEDPAKEWDGKVNGGDAVAQNGVYVWKLRTSGRRFGPVEYVGHVTLVK
jgi:gliding motility-associated-like protein